MNREKFIKEIKEILAEIVAIENENPNLNIDHLYEKISALDEYRPELGNRPYAHWIPIEYEIEGLPVIYYKCSCCDSELAYQTVFCPDCGAKME